MPRKKLSHSFSISVENIEYLNTIPINKRSRFIDGLITRHRELAETTQDNEKIQVPKQN